MNDDTPKRKPGRPRKTPEPAPDAPRRKPGRPPGPRPRLPGDVFSPPRLRLKKKRLGLRVLNGRPVVLTEEVTRRCCEYIAAGNSIETAAAACGVSHSSLRAWLKAGNEVLAREGPTVAVTENQMLYARFAQAVNIAMAEAEARDVAKMEHFLSLGDRKFLRWKMAARYPSFRAPKELRHEHSGPGGGPVPHAVGHVVSVEALDALSLEDRRRLLAALDHQQKNSPAEETTDGEQGQS